MVDFMQMKTFAEDPLILTEGDGIWVTDVDGKRYIDGISGTFCLSLGHGNSAIIEAAQKQMRRLVMAAPTMATSDRHLELAKALMDITPPQYTKMKILSGGSEVVEAAIKMARQYHKQTGAPTKYKVLSHYQAYHGVTGFALAASGFANSRVPYEPLPAGFIHLPTPDVYQPAFPVAAERLAEAYADWVEQVIRLEGPDTIAAFITEPVLMAAGVIVPPVDYLRRIRALCDKYNIVLIFDEIITGFGRVGAMFASELWDIWPDLLLVGKGISGAYAPLSAVLITDRIGQTFWGELEDDVHFIAGHTFGANPVACAVGIATIDQLRDGAIARNAAARGDQARDRLRKLQLRLPVIGDVRGIGLLVGIEFVRDPRTRERFPAEANVGVQIREVARKRGLLLRASHWMAVIAPPLTTTESEMDQILDVYEAALMEVLAPLCNAAAVESVVGV